MPTEMSSLAKKGASEAGFVNSLPWEIKKTKFLSTLYFNDL
jgi:hypothetical protein